MSKSQQPGANDSKGDCLWQLSAEQFFFLRALIMNSIQQSTSGLTFKPPHLMILYAAHMFKDHIRNSHSYVHTCPVLNYCTVRSLKKLQSFKNPPITKQTKSTQSTDLCQVADFQNVTQNNLVCVFIQGEPDVLESSLPLMEVIDLKNNRKSQLVASIYYI